MKEQIVIHWIEEVDSTNNEALRKIEMLENLAVIAAVSQTAGRGQRGNSWITQPGENLTFSLVVKFGRTESGRMEASRQFSISQAATLGVCDYLDAESIPCTIKWPNDIYLKNKKICGMLIENSLEGNSIASSVIGIGLNVNQLEFPPQLVNPTSMSAFTKRRYALKEELEKLCGHIRNKLDLLSSDPDSLEKQYISRLYRYGARNTYVDCLDGSTFLGKITGVTNAGLLQVETEKGECKEFAFKEISFVI